MNLACPPPGCDGADAVQRLDAAAIDRIVPHKGHALFIRDAEVEGWTVRGGACWSADHPHLRGHFPGQPIVPGVYLVEAAAQLAGVAIHCAGQALAGRGAPAAARIGVLAGVRKSTFHRFVRPGDDVRYTLAVKAVPGTDLYTVAGTGHVRDAKVVTVELTIAAVPANLQPELA